MKVGDLIINPHVSQYFKGNPNPMYKTMVIHIETEYTMALTYEGEVTTWCTKDIRDWKVAGNVAIKQLILNSFNEAEQMDRCIDCYFFHKLKEYKDGEWITKSCCTLLPQTEPNYGYDLFALVIGETDSCECFVDRNKEIKRLKKEVE